MSDSYLSYIYILGHLIITRNLQGRYLLQMKTLRQKEIKSLDSGAKLMFFSTVSEEQLQLT